MNISPCPTQTEERRCSRTHAQTQQRIAGRYETSSSLSAKRGPDHGHKSPARPTSSSHPLTASSVVPYLLSISKLLAFDVFIIVKLLVCLQSTLEARHYGVGVSGGVEHVALRARIHHEAGSWIIQIDAPNAFNSVFRKPMSSRWPRARQCSRSS